MTKPKTNVVTTNQAPEGEHAMYTHDKQRGLHVWVDMLGEGVYRPRWRMQEELETSDYSRTDKTYRTAIAAVRAVYVVLYKQH